MFLLCSCLMIIITGQILYFTKTCTTAHYTKTKPNHHHSMHHHKNNSRVNTSSTTAHLNALLCLQSVQLTKLTIIQFSFARHNQSAIAIERRSEFIKCSVLLNRRDVTAEKLTKQHTQPSRLGYFFFIELNFCSLKLPATVNKHGTYTREYAHSLFQ